MIKDFDDSFIEIGNDSKTCILEEEKPQPNISVDQVDTDRNKVKMEFEEIPTFNKTVSHLDPFNRSDSTKELKSNKFEFKLERTKTFVASSALSDEITI